MNKSVLIIPLISIILFASCKNTRYLELPNKILHYTNGKLDNKITNEIKNKHIMKSMDTRYNEDGKLSNVILTEYTYDNHGNYTTKIVIDNKGKTETSTCERRYLGNLIVYEKRAEIKKDSEVKTLSTFTANREYKNNIAIYEKIEVTAREIDTNRAVGTSTLTEIHREIDNLNRVIKMKESITHPSNSNPAVTSTYIYTYSGNSKNCVSSTKTTETYTSSGEMKLSVTVGKNQFDDKNNLIKAVTYNKNGKSSTIHITTNKYDKYDNCIHKEEISNGTGGPNIYVVNYTYYKNNPKKIQTMTEKIYLLGEEDFATTITENTYDNYDRKIKTHREMNDSESCVVVDEECKYDQLIPA